MRLTAFTPVFGLRQARQGVIRGLIRQHQFSKVELVSITTGEEAEAELARMTGCAETILQRLGLGLSGIAPMFRRYRLFCPADTGYRGVAAWPRWRQGYVS